MKNSRFMSFSSGSCGNCYYLEYDGEAVLIDAGVSMRRLKKVMADNGLDLASVKGVLVTHDHLDHIRHLGSFCKKLTLPVYSTPDILNALSRHSFTSDWIAPCRREIALGETVSIGNMDIRPFLVPHDATQTVGYSITMGERSFVIMTDVGRVTDEAVGLAAAADTVVLESNYDMDMLMGGPYTYELKMRIVQGCGHLSNDECAGAVRRFLHPGLKNIFLCHLSDNNNTRELAYNCTLDALREMGLSKGDVSLMCLPRQTPSLLFNL